MGLPFVFPWVYPSFLTIALTGQTLSVYLMYLQFTL